MKVSVFSLMTIRWVL